MNEFNIQELTQENETGNTESKENKQFQIETGTLK